MEKVEKKRKWEREYEKYSTSTELDERLEYLQDLINGKVATKEEYDEHKKLTAIKANLPKVKNILEFKGKLEEQGKKVKDEIARRELVGKYEKAAKILEEEMKKLQEEKLSLEGQIKDPNLDSKKKEELQTKLAENDKKRQKNNIDFGKCQEGIDAENKKAEKSEFKDVSLEDLKNETTVLKQKISMCNYACNRLMQGYSWQSVEVALDKFQGEKLTAKGQQVAKMKQNREAAKVEPEKEAPEQEKVAQEEQVVEQEEQVEEEKEENALTEVSRWQKAKIWFIGLGSKIGNGVKKVFEKFKRTEEKEEEVEEEEIKQEPKNQQVNWSEWYKNYQNPQQVKQEVEEQEAAEQEVAEQEVSKQDDFRKYLRDIAEKGMDGVEKEDKEAKRQAAIKQLIENKRNARGDDGGTIAKLEAQLKDGDER